MPGGLEVDNDRWLRLRILRRLLHHPRWRLRRLPLLASWQLPRGVRAERLSSHLKSFDNAFLQYCCRSSGPDPSSCPRRCFSPESCTGPSSRIWASLRRRPGPSDSLHRLRQRGARSLGRHPHQA